MRSNYKNITCLVVLLAQTFVTGFDKNVPHDTHWKKSFVLVTLPWTSVTSLFEKNRLGSEPTPKYYLLNISIYGETKFRRSAKLHRDFYGIISITATVKMDGLSTQELNKHSSPKINRSHMQQLVATKIVLAQYWYGIYCREWYMLYVLQPLL